MRSNKKARTAVEGRRSDERDEVLRTLVLLSGLLPSEEANIRVATTARPASVSSSLRDPSAAIKLVSLTHKLLQCCGYSDLPYPSAQVLHRKIGRLLGSTRFTLWRGNGSYEGEFMSLPQGVAELVSLRLCISVQGNPS